MWQTRVIEVEVEVDLPDFIDVTTMLALGRRLKESAEIAGVDLLRGKKVVAFGIGGAMATVARPVSAYQRRGADGQWVKYYCYSDLLPKDISGDRSVIEEVFMKIEDAAKAGYHYDMIYMNR